jgi:hypothetical protein
MPPPAGTKSLIPTLTLEQSGQASLGRFAGLSDAANVRFSALGQSELAKFASMTIASKERMAALPAGELENIAATMTETEIHRQILGRDPAVGGRFRPTEADTALRVEQARGIVLDRYVPAGPRQKGDWVDPSTNQVYDGCSPPKSRFFDLQITNGNYESSLLDHLASPSVDLVVIDITGLGLTLAQEQALEAVILRVAGPNNPKILRLP